MDRVKDVTQLIIGKEMVLIKINPKDSKTDSGIILPDSVKEEKPDTGVVVLVGSEVNDIQAGDLVLDVAKASISTFEYKGDKYLMPPRHFVRIAVRAENYE